MRTAACAFDRIAAAAPVTVGYERYSDHSAQSWLARTLKALCRAGGIAKADIDGLAVASFGLGQDAPLALVAELGLQLSWFAHLPVGGAAGVVALMEAAKAVASGQARIVACIAADTHHKGAFQDLVADFSWVWKDAVHPYGEAGPNALFAAITDIYMRRFGVDRADFGRLCVEQRAHAAANPHALLRKPMALADYLNAPPVAGPLHLFDCVMPCAGGEGFLILSAEEAERRQLAFARPLGAAAFFGEIRRDEPPMGQAFRHLANRLDRAGLLDGIDLVQTYDDYPVMVFLQLEGFGFASQGEAARLIAEGATAIDGPLAHNTSGGQLSCGQAGAAGGFLGMTEALRQLTGRPAGLSAGRRRRALVSGFGLVHHLGGLAHAAAVLAPGDRQGESS
ncbi:MAG: thiolase family protein [Alphaproteobacteria bacterium]|nr:MAG: thiolase family protein [Alphaproteobacteria bacterium]